MSRPEPIPAAILRFAIPMDGHGLSVATSVTSRAVKPESRFEVFYLPWLRHFVVRYHAPEGTPREVCISEVHVKSWDAVGSLIPSAVAEAPEVQRRK